MDKSIVDLVWPARPNFSLSLIKFIIKVGLVDLGC